MSPSIVLSHYQTQALLQQAGNIGASVPFSVDLGRSTQTAQITPEGITFDSPGDSPPQSLTWDTLQEIAANPNNCYSIKAGLPEKIITFSDLTNSTYSLYPTAQAPTMLISGIPMHRIKNTDPSRDTREKIKAARPAGRVLDTATGLGYTAIHAAQKSQHVITVELDPAAQSICQQNPWSQELFTAANIEQRIGDSYDVIETLKTGRFSRIIHDPPTFSLAGHLYSAGFYGEMYRILKPGGRAFHYIGDPDSKSGRTTTAGVIRRLEKVGFHRVQRAPRAFGVVAYK